jgi:hypothetical protein
LAYCSNPTAARVSCFITPNLSQQFTPAAHYTTIAAPALCRESLRGDNCGKRAGISSQYQ